MAALQEQEVVVEQEVIEQPCEIIKVPSNRISDKITAEGDTDYDRFTQRRATNEDAQTMFVFSENDSAQSSRQ